MGVNGGLHLLKHLDAEGVSSFLSLLLNQFNNNSLRRPYKDKNTRSTRELLSSYEAYIVTSIYIPLNEDEPIFETTLGRQDSGGESFISTNIKAKQA